jgi:FixJ family two-component response regulator
VRCRPLVAVVDDDRRVLESLENLLASAGYAARTFTGGAALLADPCLADIDCLVSDIAMPRMDGYRLQQRVHVSRPRLPIIFVTAHDASDLPAHHMPRALVLLRKPFEGPELLAAIDRALRASDQDAP